METAAQLFDQSEFLFSYHSRKWCLKVVMDSTICLHVLSIISGVTGIFGPPLFVSALIFIKMKDTGCKLSANINLVFGSPASKSSSRGLICVKCFPSCLFSSAAKILAALQPPPLYRSRFILLRQDKPQRNVIQLSGCLSLGAFIYLSGCSGLLSCQLTLADS